MMATAPTVNEPADVSASTNPQLTSSANNVDAAPPAVNGVVSHDEIENKHTTHVEETTNSAEASASGGSDTEATKVKDEEKSHVRTGSTVKKPATFKAVSVNKKFLASKAPAPSSTPKLTDTKSPASTPPPSGTGAQAGRPRLVAKTGSAAGNGSSRSGVNGGKPAGPPDGSAVWNKNQALPPAEKKKFTDEDMRKYGIHLAERLPEDEETSGQNKWADIDDDDDDWAPDAITWTDGTKTTLPHPDEAPPPTAPEPTVANYQQQQQPPPSKSPAPAFTAPQQRQGLPSGRGMVLNRPAQKDNAVAAKPSVQQSAAKSPWAPLPPVERASPVGQEAQPASRGAMNQSWSQKGPAPSGHHMRDISADDFSRSSWRGSETQGNRELFNSHSGRYEPVPERRGSLRPDQPKYPAVLQRPSGNEHPEPSSAFQTTRTSQEGHFGNRRRGSSNVSGGSGQWFQNPGKGSDGNMPLPEMSAARRPSFAVSSEGPVSPALHSAGLNRGYQQPPQAYPPRPSPGANFAAPHQAGPPENAVPHAPAPQAQSDIDYQAKLMKESREAARKRRLEQEEADENAKRERIRMKLEAMGPAPEKKPQKEASPVQQQLRPTHIQQRERAEPSDKAQPPSGPRRDSGSADNKVSQGARVPPNNRPGAQNETPVHAANAPRRLSHGQESRQTSNWTGPGPAPVPPPGPASGSGSASRAPGFSSWNAGSQPPRNVWGSPNNNQGLGNGTFNPSLSQMLEGSTAAPPQSGKGPGPAPIGPPNMSREPSQGRQPQPPAPIGSRPNRYQPGPDLTSKWVTSVADNDRKLTAERVAQKTEMERQLAERGLKPEDAQPAIKETWRQVQVNNDGRQTVASRDSTVGRAWQARGDEAQRPREAAGPAAHPGVIGSGAGSAAPGQASAQGKTSRFFPARDVRYEFPSRPGSPTPPPPTEEGHPVYEGDVSHPNVSLPRPQPVVKLPPAALAAQAKAPRAPQSFAWATPTPYRDAAQAAPPTGPRRRSGETQSAWQQKFNNLFSHGSAAIDASSKSALDYSYLEDSATVSLPGALRSTDNGASSKFSTSKPMAEECFDEPEMGSTPSVSVPRTVPVALWQPAEPISFKPLHRKHQISPHTSSTIFFPVEVVDNVRTICILFPGMTAQRTVGAPHSSGGRGRGKRGRGGNRGNDRRESDRRETSSTTHEPTEPTGSPGSTPIERGGRGRGRGRGYRGRGSDWSRRSAVEN